MADNAVVHIGENSPEHVASRLTQFVLFDIEGRKVRELSRKEFLDTYSEVLEAVKGFRSKPREWPSERS
jgi:hypothetical protein